jgi:hypothetical protein
MQYRSKSEATHFAQTQHRALRLLLPAISFFFFLFLIYFLLLFFFFSFSSFIHEGLENFDGDSLFPFSCYNHAKMIMERTDRKNRVVAFALAQGSKQKKWQARFIRLIHKINDE